MQILGVSTRRRVAVALTALALVVGGCGGARTDAPGPASAAASSAVAGAPGPAQVSTAEYRLGSGDKVRLTVYGEPELSGEFEVDGSGRVALPLIGNIDVSNATLREFEQRVVTRLEDGYLKDPKVAAEVLNYRPFYIIGEVQAAGEYPYKNGLTIISAVALAGGYTYRANQSIVYLRRANSSGEKEVPVSNSIPINPGDVIRVPERYF